MMMLDITQKVLFLSGLVVEVIILVVVVVAVAGKLVAFVLHWVRGFEYYLCEFLKYMRTEAYNI
jgi:hypothetical protein